MARKAKFEIQRSTRSTERPPRSLLLGEVHPGTRQAALAASDFDSYRDAIEQVRVLRFEVEIVVKQLVRDLSAKEKKIQFPIVKR